jgi:hypothetical protein
VTLNEHDDVRFPASVAEIVTVVVPTGKKLPLGGLVVKVKEEQSRMMCP